MAIAQVSQVSAEAVQNCIPACSARKLDADFVHTFDQTTVSNHPAPADSDLVVIKHEPRTRRDPRRSPESHPKGRDVH